jgi:hypothetical protein
MGVARNTLLKVMLVAMDRCFSLKKVWMVVNNGSGKEHIIEGDASGNG